jgi:microcystin-dependent protein
MVQPFIGEVKIFGGTYAPEGYEFCDGSLLPIDKNDALYRLLGTAYGGDGVTTFGLPDLRGRAPVHRGSLSLGSKGGEEEVTLTDATYGKHSHTFSATLTLADQPSPAGNVPAQSGVVQLYADTTPDVEMDPSAVKPVPKTAVPHENMHPFQAINYIIATVGIFPNRS